MAKKYRDEELHEIEAQFRNLVEVQAYTYILASGSVAARKTLTNALRKAGSENVLEAKDGKEALALLEKKVESKHVVVVIEINTAGGRGPRHDGMWFLQKIRAEESVEQPQVILVGDEIRKDLLVAAAKLKANGFLKRPVTAEALMEKLQELNAI